MASARMGSLQSLWHAVLAVLAVLVLLSASATGLAYLRVGDAVQAVHSTAVPAQSAAAELTMAYVTQADAELGYLMTGDATFLQQYSSAWARSARLQTELARLLGADRLGTSWLDRATASGSVWHTDVAAENTRRQQHGPVDAGQVVALAVTGRQHFDPVLTQLEGLSTYTHVLTQAQLSRISRARHAAAVITASAVTIVLGVIGASLLLMRRKVHRPLARLLSQVRGTTDGTYDAPIDAAGPTELATIGAAVEGMRRRIIDDAERLVTTERQLALRDERDRMAADLHDLTVQQVFGIGLALRILSDQHPDLAGELAGIMDDAEQTILELRSVIYGISRSPQTSASCGEQIQQLVHDSVRFLGFEPTLRLDGPIDSAATPQLTAELTTTLREALSNAARHAEASTVRVTVSVADGQLHLAVSDNGRGLAASPTAGNGIINMRHRAERLDGHATITTAATSGTRLDWHVPINRPTPPRTPATPEATAPVSTTVPAAADAQPDAVPNPSRPQPTRVS